MRKLITKIVIQVVRTRLRLAPTEGGMLKYTGLAQCFRLVWKEEGLAGMYGGLTPHLMRVVPSAAIMFGMYVPCRPFSSLCPIPDSLIVQVPLTKDTC